MRCSFTSVAGSAVLGLSLLYQAAGELSIQRPAAAFQARSRLQAIAFGSTTQSPQQGRYWPLRQRCLAPLSAPTESVPVLFPRGGARASTMSPSSVPSGRFSFAGLWGILGILAVLGNAIRRLLPIAMEPFKVGGFTPALWAAYFGFSLFMAYAEGYKGFQLKFSPLVVRRALTLGPQSPWHHKILATPFSMGLFHSTRKRKIVSYSLAVGIFGLIKLVKALSYPWRSIIDAGVVVGLTYGATSIAALYAAALSGRLPDIDPALPDSKEA